MPIQVRFGLSAVEPRGGAGRREGAAAHASVAPHGSRRGRHEGAVATGDVTVGWLRRGSPWLVRRSRSRDLRRRDRYRRGRGRPGRVVLQFHRACLDRDRCRSLHHRRRPLRGRWAVRHLGRLAFAAVALAFLPGAVRAALRAHVTVGIARVLCRASLRLGSRTRPRAGSRRASS